MEDIGLEEKKNGFIEDCLAGKGTAKAAERAKFASPAKTINQVVSSVKTRKYVRSAIQGRLEVEGGPMAYYYMLRVLKDETADRRLRLDTAKYLFAAAGYTPPKAAEAPKQQDDKAFSEMTNEELRQFIERTESELANRATPIEGQVLIEHIQPEQPQTLDDLM